MFERLGGSEAHRAAEAFLTNPSEETFPEYQRVFPAVHAAASAAGSIRPHDPPPGGHAAFQDSGEMFAFDYRTGLKSIRCPVLLMAGVLDPIITIEDAANSQRLCRRRAQPSESFRARDTCLHSKTRCRHQPHDGLH